MWMMAGWNKWKVDDEINAESLDSLGVLTA